MAFRGKYVVALIPARSGSKGLLKKNLRHLNGKPLLQYAIEAATACEFIDEIILSSDCEEILDLGRRLRIRAHLRSAAAASDEATASQVVADVISGTCRDILPNDAYLVYLQPTSPLRTGFHISSAFELMSCTRSESCVSVSLIDKSPFKSYVLSPEGRLQSLFDEEKTNSNRQSLPVAYYPNGAIYIFLLHEYLTNGRFPTNGAIPYIMSQEESIDIDTEQDLIYAEGICRRK